MATKDSRAEPTQRTHKGVQIPIPSRGDFFADLKKAATPVKKKSKRRAKKK